MTAAHLPCAGLHCSRVSSIWLCHIVRENCVTCYLTACLQTQPLMLVYFVGSISVECLLAARYSLRPGDFLADKTELPRVLSMKVSSIQEHRFTVKMDMPAVNVQ